MTIELKDDNFEAEVTNSSLPVLVNFWAPWCAPCTTLEPIIQGLADSATTFKVGSLNVMAQRRIAQQYSVSNVPTLIMFKNGKVEETLVGEQTKEALDTMIAKVVS